MIDPRRDGNGRHEAPSRSVPVLLLSASLLFVGLLALQAYRAERAREAGARSTLLGYAQVVAFQVASEAYQALNREVPTPFAALDRAPRGTRGVEVLLEAAGEAARCAPALEGGRWTFRVPLVGTGAGAVGDPDRTEWFGDVPPSQLRARVVEAALEGMAGLSQDGGSYSVILLDTGVAPTLVAVAVRWRPPPENTSVYGFRSCFEGASASLFREAMTARAALPPALTGGASADEIFAARVVRAGADRVGTGAASVWTSPEPGDAFAAGDTASLRLWPPFADLSVEVALRPAMRARLVPGAGQGGFATTLGLFLLNGVLLGAALVQMNRERQLMRVREGFVSAVSHELRTPLQQMLLYADLLQLGGLRSDAERARAEEVLARETRRLIHLVDNILEFRPSGRGAAPVLSDEPWALDELVATVVEEFAPLAEARRAVVRSETRSGAEVLLHPDAARRILLNLLDNAVKYGPVGGQVLVRTERAGDRAVLTVDDDGPGIAPGERGRVFRAYVRGERHLESDTGGTGIGLAIVLDLVERAGGSVRAEEAPGGGARIRVELPVPQPTAGAS